MKKILSLIILFPNLVIAQQSSSYSSLETKVPKTSRFEIIQSEMIAKATLKLDKFTGRVTQLVKGKNGNVWQYVITENHPQDKKVEGKVNYQIFTSGIAVKYTFLLNINSGATWQLSEENGTTFWAVTEDVN